MEQSLGSTWNARSTYGTAARLLRLLYCLLAGDIISVLYPPLERAKRNWNAAPRPLEQSLQLPLSALSPLPSPISKACAPCACFLFVANVCFPLLNHAYWAFSCSKRQLLLEFLFFILTFQKKALSLHPQRIQYSRISSLSLESVVVYPTISAQGYTWRPVSLGLSRRRAHLSARKGGPFFFSASILETIWNHLKLSGTIWNYLELFGTALGHLDRPQGNWNSRRLLERPPALDRPQGYFVLFIGSRYYLRPIILWNARRAIGTAAGQLEQPSGPLEQSLRLYLERPQGFWNRAFDSTWNALGAQ